MQFGSKLFGTLIVFLKVFFKKLILKKSQQAKTFIALKNTQLAKGKGKYCNWIKSQIKMFKK